MGGVLLVPPPPLALPMPLLEDDMEVDAVGQGVGCAPVPLAASEKEALPLAVPHRSEGVPPRTSVPVPVALPCAEGVPRAESDSSGEALELRCGEGVGCALSSGLVVALPLAPSFWEGVSAALPVAADKGEGVPLAVAAPTDGEDNSEAVPPAPKLAVPIGEAEMVAAGLPVPPPGSDADTDGVGVAVAARASDAVPLPLEHTVPLAIPLLLKQALAVLSSVALEQSDGTAEGENVCEVEAETEGEPVVQGEGGGEALCSAADGVAAVRGLLLGGALPVLSTIGEAEGESEPKGAVGVGAPPVDEVDADAQPLSEGEAKALIEAKSGEAVAGNGDALVEIEPRSWEGEERTEMEGIAVSVPPPPLLPLEHTLLVALRDQEALKENAALPLRLTEALPQTLGVGAAEALPCSVRETDAQGAAEAERRAEADVEGSREGEGVVVEPREKEGDGVVPLELLAWVLPLPLSEGKREAVPVSVAGAGVALPPPLLLLAAAEYEAQAEGRALRVAQVEKGAVTLPPGKEAEAEAEPPPPAPQDAVVQAVREGVGGVVPVGSSGVAENVGTPLAEDVPRLDALGTIGVPLPVRLPPSALPVPLPLPLTALEAMDERVPGIVEGEAASESVPEPQGDAVPLNSALPLPP